MPNARGVRLVRAVLRATREPALTRSEAERRLLELIRASGLPVPRVNARLQGFEVDFGWEREALVVEVDGYAFHASRAAFERDRRRDAVLQLAGHRVLRVTWRQIVDEPYALVAQLAGALTRR